MIGLCMGLAGALWAQVELREFTLAWRHSVEKIRWEEDYRVMPDGLLLEEARVQGSGAGMEIPPGARLHAGSWRYRPALPPQQPLRLGRAPEAGDYLLCGGGECRPLAYWLGPPRTEQPVVELWSCELKI